MPHVLHTIWLDSHEPTNKDTLWIKPLKKDYYGIFVYGSNGWVLTTAMFKGTIGEFVIDQLPEATPETNGVMSAQDKADLDHIKDSMSSIDKLVDILNNIDEAPVDGSHNLVISGGIYEQLKSKVDAIPGKGLSTMDFTEDDKQKLDSIPDDIIDGIQSDWNETDEASSAYVKNKPDLSGYVTSAALNTALAGKQDTISDLATIRSGAALGATALQSYTETDPTVSTFAKTSSGYYILESQDDPDIEDDQGDLAIPTWHRVTTEGYIKTETDPTVPSWAKASTKPSYTAVEVGAQPTLVSGTNIKTINNQSLLGSGNITIKGGGSGGDSPVSVIDTINGDFELQDESGNVLLRLANGHIQTKKFNSSDFSVEEKKPLRILFFGNSLTQDAVAYLPLVLQEVAPEIDFHIYLWYNGGQNLTNQYQTYLLDPTKNCGIFSQFKSGDTKWTNYSNNKNMNWVIANCDFDILCLQEYGNNGQSDSQIITAFDNISDWFATYYDKPLKVVSLMDAPARGDVPGVTTRIEHYNQVFYQNCPSEGIIPAGLAMSYACQDTTLNQLGDSGGLSPDGVHAQEGLPCLLQSYVVAMWLFREMGITKSIWGSKLRITTAIYTALDVPGANLGTGVITGTDAENLLAQRCAIKAMKRGRELEVLTVNS